jgi:chromosome segregation ATPase
VEIEENVGHIEERECPTPSPENVYICGECNKGFTSEGKVKEHMKNDHPDTHLQEEIKRLESELRLEKGQHQDHLKMLEETLKQINGYKQYIEKLVVLKSDLETHIESLKKDLDEGELTQEIVNLKTSIEEKEKQLQKNECSQHYLTSDNFYPVDPQIPFTICDRGTVFF